MVEARQDEPDHRVGPPGQQARALVGKVAQALDSLFDQPTRLGAHALWVVDRIRYRSQRDARLARHVADVNSRHLAPVTFPHRVLPISAWYLSIATL